MRLNRMLAGATAGAAMLVLAGGQAAMAAPSAAPSTAPSTAPKTCSADQLAYVQARVDLAVAHRQLALTGVTGLLAQRPHVTDAHRATLSGLVSSDSTGLTTTDAKVHADTTCKQAVTDGRTVVTSYRVFMLLVPQAHLVTASDTGAYGAGKLAATEPTLQAGIDAITDPTKKAQAQAAFDDLVAQTKVATDDFAGVGDVVLALVPADMPAKQGTLTTERGKVQNGRTALRSALKDAKTIGSLLG